jgi:guanylate kinase
VGCSGSGKDTILNELIKNSNFTPIVSYATRPMRDGEVEGREYKFISEEKFAIMSDNGEFLESVTYCNNFYGLHKDDVGFMKVVIIEPNGLLQLKEKYKGLLVPVFIDVNEEERMVRMIKAKRGVDYSYQRIVNDRTAFKNAADICGFSVCNYNLDTSVKWIQTYYAFEAGFKEGKV